MRGVCSGGRPRVHVRTPHGGKYTCVLRTWYVVRGVRRSCREIYEAAALEAAAVAALLPLLLLPPPQTLRKTLPF